MVATSCSQNDKVACLAWREKEDTFVLIANLTADEQTIDLSGVPSGATLGVLDEDSYIFATTNAKMFRRAGKLLGESQIRLGGYAVAYLAY